MSPIVTSAIIWPYAGDFPYVDLEVKGIQTFMWFSKHIEYFVPRTKHFLWPGNAEEDGIDTRTHPYEWWLVLDGKNAISCMNKQIHGIEYMVYNREADCQTTVVVTEAEAKEIKAAVDRMVAEVKGFEKGGAGFLRPPHHVGTFPVKSRIFRDDNPKSTIKHDRGPLFSMEPPSSSLT